MMGRFACIKKDLSSSNESDPERHMRDNSGSTACKRNSYLKNVVVLLGHDVRKNDGKVYLPHRKELFQLKRPERGQFKPGIKFSHDMTEEKVLKKLRLHFPMLGNNGRLSCATAVDQRTRLEFHNSAGTVLEGSGTVWNGAKIHRLARGNTSLYVLFEGTPESVYERPASSPQLQTPMPEPMGKQSGKRKNDESASAALCKCTKASSVGVVPSFGNSITPMQWYPGNMPPFGPQGHPSTTTIITGQNNISSQNFNLSKVFEATGSQKYAIPDAHTHSRKSSTIVPGHQTQASGGILPSAHPLSTSSFPHVLNFSMQTSSVQGYQKQIQTGLDQQHVLQNTNSLLPGTTQGGGSSMVTLEPRNICHGSAPAFPTVGSQCGSTTSDMGNVQYVVSGSGGILLSATQQRTGEDKSNRPKVVSKITLDSGNICPRSVPAHPTVGSQASVPGQSQIAGQGKFPSTCFAYNTAGDQISQNTQTSGASLTESGILDDDLSQQTAVTGNLPPYSYELDSGWSSFWNKAMGVAIANNCADQLEDTSILSENFSSSEDGDAALEKGREMWFESQMYGVVKEIIPSSGPIGENIRFCIILAQKLPRKYRKLKFITNFEDIDAVPLHIQSGSTLTGNIISYVAGKVKVTVGYEGSNGKSIGFTCFEFTNKTEVILREISEVKLGQLGLFNTLKSLFESSDSGIQEATPCGAGGTGIDDAQLVSSLDGNDNQSDYEADNEASSSSSPADTNANDDELDDSELGDIGQITLDKNDSRDSIATEAERQRYQVETERQAGSGSSFTNKDDSEMEMESLPHDKNDSRDSIATEAESQRHQTGTERQAEGGSLFTNRDDSEMEMESLSHGTDNVEIKSDPRVSYTDDSEKSVVNSAQDAVTNVALHPNQEGADPADDHFVSSAVMSVAGETSNAIELSSEGGANSSAERQNQEPTDSMTISLPCEINTGTLMNRYIQTTTKNTFWKRYCSETDQKEGQDELEKPLVKQGTPTYEEVEVLAYQISGKWMKLGRLLGVKEPKLQYVDQRHKQLYEKAYHMLMIWKQENGRAATHQLLTAALQHELVQRKDLAEQICHKHDSEFNLSLKEMAFAPEGITNVTSLLNQGRGDSDGNPYVTYDVFSVAEKMEKSSELALKGAKNSEASHLDQGPIVAAATVPPYGNKKQRLACPFTQTPNSSCIETDHEEDVGFCEWPLMSTDDNHGEIWPFIKSEEQQDLSAKTIHEVDPVIAKLCPKEGPITGGTEFLIFLKVEGIPEDLTSLRARFKGVGFAYLTHVREGIYSGHTPASKILGKVAVNVVSVDDTWNSPDETEFEYHPILTQELQKLISTMPTKRNTPLDYQTLNPSRSAGTDRDDTEMLEHSRCDDNHGDTVDKLKLSFCSLDDVFDSLNDDQVKSANEEIINVSSHVDQEGASPGVTISPVSVIATVPVAGEVLNRTVGVSEGMANCRAALHSQEPFGFTITAPLSEDRDSAQRLDIPFIEKKIENGKADGKECSAYSVCPLGFGLKEPCSKTKNTECQPCYPGSDYSDSTGMEECIKCDTYSNCLPGRSKKITKCTIFSGHTCDGCEEGYYHHQDLGCDKCSPKCDATTEDEIQACTTKHNRVCAPKRVLPKTPPIFSNDSKGGHPNNTTNDEDDEIPLNGPKLEESKTNQPREENLIFENLWLWVLLMVIVVLVVIGSMGPYKIRSRRNRPTQPEGDVNTHNTEENIALREQTIPLITGGGVDAHDTRETVSLGPRHELEPLKSGGVDAPEPSSEELSKQKALGLDRPIKDLRIKEKKQIKNDLSGKDIEGYFYWQSIAEELDLKDESRGWEGAQNPIKTLLKAFGVKEGSTIRGLIEATRRAGPTHCARQLENQFDTAPRNDTTDSVHKPMVQNKANDNSTFVDIPSDPGKEMVQLNRLI